MKRASSRHVVRLAAFLALSGALMAGAVACGGGSAPPTATDASAVASSSPIAAVPTEWFTESAQATGIDFTHVNGATGKFYYPEILPPGVALFDAAEY